VYQTRDEWAAEVSNQTVHAVMHIGWVRDDSGSGHHAPAVPPGDRVPAHAQIHWAKVAGFERQVLAKHAASMGMKAMAITDHGAMFGAVGWAAACKKAGIKPSQR
jgi:DNA polymerase III alpha subunit (gram-positive type)